LKHLDGVITLKVDFMTGLVKVKFDPNVTGPRDMISRINTVISSSALRHALATMIEWLSNRSVILLR